MAFDRLPSVGQAVGIAQTTCNQGERYLRAWTPAPETTGERDPYTPKRKAERVAHEQNRNTVHDTPGVCLFVAGAGGPFEIHSSA